jgi:hypothetical protein
MGNIWYLFILSKYEKDILSFRLKTIGPPDTINPRFLHSKRMFWGAKYRKIYHMWFSYPDTYFIRTVLVKDMQPNVLLILYFFVAMYNVRFLQLKSIAKVGLIDIFLW